MGMHPVARFNLGKGKKGARMHIVIHGNKGNGEDIEFEPNNSYPYLNNKRNEIEASVEQSTRVYLGVLFGKGDNREIYSFSIVAPKDLSIQSTNSDRMYLDSVDPISPNEASIRGLDPNNYVVFSFEYDDSLLMVNDTYSERIVISTVYKGNYINLDLNLQVVW